MAVTLSAPGETVRRHDPDRFMLSLLAPASVRPDIWALFAFNHEIAKTREVVTDTRLGLIRLQWWREAIGAIYAGGGPAPEHPVVAALGAAIQNHKLPQEHFDALIYAREFDLEDRLPSSMEGTVKYAEFTSLPLMELLRGIVAPEGDADLRPLATGYALTGILRATPLHLSQRRCYLPADRLPMVHRQYDGKELDALQQIVHEVVGIAWQNLADAPRLALPKILRGHRKLAHMWLKKIEFAGYDLFSPALRVPPFMREIRLLLS